MHYALHTIPHPLHPMRHVLYMIHHTRRAIHHTPNWTIHPLLLHHALCTVHHTAPYTIHHASSIIRYTVLHARFTMHHTGSTSNASTTCCVHHCVWVSDCASITAANLHPIDILVAFRLHSSTVVANALVSTRFIAMAARGRHVRFVADSCGRCSC